MNANESIHSIPYFENPFEGLVPHVKRSSEETKLNKPNNALPSNSVEEVDKVYTTYQNNVK